MWSLALYLFLEAQLWKPSFLASPALRIVGIREISPSVKEQPSKKVEATLSEVIAWNTFSKDEGGSPDHLEPEVNETC